MIGLLPLEAAAEKLGTPARWLNRFLRTQAVDQLGMPLYRSIGRDKLVYVDRARSCINAPRGPRAESIGEGYIYFIAAGDFIKIGFSRAMHSRMVKISTDCPIEPEVLHTEPGSFKIEKVVHRQFRELRARGEWFRKSDELMAYIEQRKRFCEGAGK